ncbi:hypothetical protein ACIA49_41800 [Kribbella sp. NPDC051587]|uniref:hypothetical protein n=1 Tax=Kribbella sp. NPDC051587 TaxID=3364119 RepID=UPI0037AE51D2
METLGVDVGQRSVGDGLSCTAALCEAQLQHVSPGNQEPVADSTIHLSHRGAQPSAFGRRGRADEL